MANNNSPRVSVCIPTYNYAGYIAAAIKSVLQQTYQNFELVIIDDCSADHTEEIIRKYVDQDKRIRFYKNEKNLGMVENWNLCLERTTGEFIKIMGADDLLEPSCLDKSVAVLEDNPGVALVSCVRLLIDQDSQPIETVSFSQKSQIISGTDVIRKCFLGGNLIGEPTAVLFRKNSAARGFNPQYRQLVDLEMWFHLLEKGDFAFIADTLCSFRMHQKQVTKENLASDTAINDLFQLYHDYIDKDYLGMSLFNKYTFKIGIAYFSLDQRKRGVDLRLIKAALSRHIGSWSYYPLLASKHLRDFIKKN